MRLDPGMGGNGSHGAHRPSSTGLIATSGEFERRRTMLGVEAALALAAATIAEAVREGPAEIGALA